MGQLESRGDALERFERAAAVPMLVLALAIIPLLVIPLVFDISEGLEGTFTALEWFIWAAFVVEYGIRLYLAPVKSRFVRSNLVDLFVIVLPFLRPLRVLRSARALRVLRASRTAGFIMRALVATNRVLSRHKLNYVLLVTLFVVVVGAVLVLSFEQGTAEGNITSLGDALWWALTTVTTVGYGDRFPTTAGGRGIAVVLMVVGIALFGFLAAVLASYFVETHEEESVDPKLQEIADRLERIERKMAHNAGKEGNEKT